MFSPALIRSNLQADLSSTGHHRSSLPGIGCLKAGGIGSCSWCNNTGVIKPGIIAGPYCNSMYIEQCQNISTCTAGIQRSLQKWKISPAGVQPFGGSYTKGSPSYKTGKTFANSDPQPQGCIIAGGSI